jgi:hypothetical protein
MSAGNDIYEKVGQGQPLLAQLETEKKHSRTNDPETQRWCGLILRDVSFSI